MKKHNASFLLELMLGISIASGLFFILFKVYNTILKGTQFVKNISDIETQKEQLRFNIIQDGITLILPIDILHMYEIANKINKKDTAETDKNKIETNNKKKDSKDNNNNNNKEKEKQTEEENNKLKKEFEEYLKYLPKIYKTEDGITISWITTRDLITKEKRKVVEVTYKFEKIKLSNVEKNDSLYKLYRIERFLFDDKKNKTKKYTMIKFVENPKLFFISPFFDKKAEAKLLKEKEKEKKSFFKKWKNNLTYKTIYDQKISDIKLFLENPIIPFEIILECDVLSNDKEKKIPLMIRIPIAIAEYALELFLDFEQKNKEFNDRLKNSSLDNNKKETNKIENNIENNQKNEIKNENKENKNTEAKEKENSGGIDL